MNTYFSIRIKTKEENFHKLDKIFFNKKIFEKRNFWEINLNSIKDACDILSKKNSLLEDIGIKKESITFWLLYEYDNECNLEFDTKELTILSSLGITFCISCWQK